MMRYGWWGVDADVCTAAAYVDGDVRIYVHHVGA